MRLIHKFVAHGKRVQKMAARHGWLPGARYTNLRDVRGFERLGFLDINWKAYDYPRHLAAARQTRPMVTVARDLERAQDLGRLLQEAAELAEYATYVIVVPKVRALMDQMEEIFPKQFLFGFSVPTRYGATKIPPEAFTRRVHLLGGRPDVQRRLATRMNVVSVDCNRFTLDAAYGDYFDGETFRPHPTGGYERCLRASIRNITALWKDYRVAPEHGLSLER